METRRIHTLTVLALILAAALALVSFFGAFAEGTYARDAESMAVQGIGQDLFNLFAVVPLLLFTLMSVRKGNQKALPVMGGTVAYILYSFVIYAFGVHFNQMFLLYCLVLGLSLYTFILILEATKTEIPEVRFAGTRPAAIFLLLVAFLFYVLWLKDVVPAIIGNRTPKSVSDYQLLVNPVHVLDIAIVLPGLVMTGILLLRRHQTGLMLAPVCLVFVILMALALLCMVIMLKARGIDEDLSVAAVFIVMAAVSAGLLKRFFNNSEST